jgi:hypothetical protein
METKWFVNKELTSEKFESQINKKKKAKWWTWKKNEKNESSYSIKEENYIHEEKFKGQKE